ncbi:hypothetical protein N7519_001721 [Penicillium mononematosum]|uniref:uncharacterized protein n=1 Tax=Penicillium mononematosum TaxID=268346 RepID=UPI0025482112|nr:uncharacterized protein N7519_001721 [Penicillium mononematosum]KAJ6186813.1 hypothetical protein N7519_001721 [Penicillium mononematosum]
MTFDALSPREVTEAVSRTGAHKGNMRLDKVFLSAVSAGCLLAFACGTTLSTTATPWFQDNAPGLIRTIGALVFPYVYYISCAPSPPTLVKNADSLGCDIHWQPRRIFIYRGYHLRL